MSATVHLRAAGSEDINDIARIINDPPEPPMAKLLGQERATKLGTLLVKSGAYPTLENTTLAEVDGRVAGVLACGAAEGPALMRELLPLAPRLLLLLGPVTPRAIYGFWLRGRLMFDIPPDAFVVSELYVDEKLRNRGIGGRLLQHANVLALEAKESRMWVETGVTNPARRLYERHGYRAVEEKTSIAYQRLTDSPGRVLMTKELSS